MMIIKTQTYFYFYREKAKKAFCLLFLISLSICSNISAQCPMTCNNGVQASLNEDCLNEITWDALLEGTPPPACIDDFSVTILGPNGIALPSSPFVTENEINKTLVGKLTHLPSGQSCQTNILVQDKLAPQIFCVDTLVSCFHDTTPAILGYPEYYDNCTFEVTVNHFDQNTTYNCTASDTILLINRQWTATDSSGNTAHCWQKIYVERPELDSLDFPVSLDNISAPPLYCTSAQTDPSYTGIPNFDSLRIDSISAFYVDYEEVTVPICDGSYTIFREWTVYDGCRATSRTEEQTINVMDTLAPSLVCPIDFSVTVANNECYATVNLPQPATLDSCSSDITLSLEGDFGLINGMTISNLAMGEYPTICHATDDCGNVSSCHFNITVIDNIPPVAVSVSNPIISLLPQGVTYLPAASFNGGSWDNCDDLIFKVKRVEPTDCAGNTSTDFADQVPFYCCDYGTQVEISLRVTDLSGNSSTVNTFVQVTDNIAPTMICPAKLTLDCGEDYTDVTVTGEPEVTENCSGFDVSFADTVDLNICGEGTIVRHWKVTDITGKKANCTQEIQIENATPFYINPTNFNDPNDHVIWPKNYLSTSCGDGLLPHQLPAEFAFPQILSDSACQMIAINYSDTWLSQPNNACIEILRSWTIVDWCQFNPATFAGSWQYGQVIRIQSSEHPEIVSACEYTEFCSYDSDCQRGSIQYTLQAIDDCNEPHELKYNYSIDFSDDGSMDLTGTGATVDADVPMGMHRIYWEVTDGCANKTACDYLFSVVDCQKPTAVCQAPYLEITDTSNLAVTLLAIDLDGGSSDNCSPDDALHFSFSTDTADTLRVFECPHIGFNDLELWVTDKTGNQGFCQVKVEVQAFNSTCSDNAIVSGQIALENGDYVLGVQVSLNSLTPFDSVITGANGAYLFDNVPVEEDYTITPYKNSNPLNGVTTFDLVLISRHVLGTSLFTSPYKIIAADANRSGTVTTFDIVVLRKLILNISSTFPNNNSWRFIDKNYQFVNSANPLNEAFPEIVNINNLAGDWKADFVAIKVGDVNDSANVEE